MESASTPNYRLMSTGDLLAAIREAIVADRPELAVAIIDEVTSFAREVNANAAASRKPKPAPWQGDPSLNPNWSKS